MLQLQSDVHPAEIILLKPIAARASIFDMAYFVQGTVGVCG